MKWAVAAHPTPQLSAVSAVTFLHAARAYRTSDQRAAHLPEWVHNYYWHRPHGGINSAKPISRPGLTEDNLVRLHS